MEVAVERGSQLDELTVKLLDLPAGVTASDSRIATDSSQVQLAVQTSADAVIGGPFPIRVQLPSKGSAAPIESQVSLFVTGNPGQLDVSQTSTAAIAVSVGGSDVPLDASADGLGRTVLVGSGKNTDGTDVAWATRVASDGKLDKTFGEAGVTSGFANPPSFAQQLVLSDNGVFIWTTATANNSAVRFIRKLELTGKTAEGFATSAGGDLITVGVGVPMAFVPFGNEMLALAGPTGRPFAVNVNGTIDSSFSAPPSTNAQAIAIDALGGVLFGEVRTVGLLFGRLSAKGAVDESFGKGGTFTTPAPAGAKSTTFVTLMIEPDTSITALIQSLNSDSAGDSRVQLIGIAPNGAPNPAFGSLGTTVIPAAGTAAFAYGSVTQTDGKIVVLYGDWNATSQKFLSRLARYDAAGALDETFATKGILDLSAVKPQLKVHGLAYESSGNRAVIFGSSADGILVQRVWL
jgi:hypothetical protein